MWWTFCWSSLSSLNMITGYFLNLSNFLSWKFWLLSCAKRNLCAQLENLDPLLVLKKIRKDIWLGGWDHRNTFKHKQFWMKNFHIFFGRGWNEMAPANLLPCGFVKLFVVIFSWSSIRWWFFLLLQLIIYCSEKTKHNFVFWNG